MGKIIENVLNADEIKSIIDSLNIEPGKTTENNSYVSRAMGFYSAPETLKYVDRIEQYVRAEFNTNLKFENSFTRVCYSGSFLRIHTDRIGLDYTVSMCLKRDVAWPLCISKKLIGISDEQTYAWDPKKYNEDDWLNSEFDSYDCLPGSMVTAEGRRYPHWRNPLVCDENQTNIYVFYHWSKV
jgi:hypothetical protein